MISALLAYDAAGNVVATLGHMVARNDAGEVVGLIDFEAAEAAGVLRDVWDAPGSGLGTWPEWIGAQAHDFTVELGPDKRIAALVRKPTSAGERDQLGRFRPTTTGGYRRERAAIEAAIAAVLPDRSGARDIRHLVGGPMAPLALDSEGRTIGPDHPQAPKGTPAHLPLLGPPPRRL